MTRWNEYFLKHGESFNEFWQQFLNEKERNVLFIIGKGFDPRMCHGVKEILNVNGSGKRDCFQVNFAEGDDSPSNEYGEYVENNLIELKKLFQDRGTILEKNIELENFDGDRIGPRKAAELFKNLDEFVKYTDVVIDISSLPLNIYFPLIGKILTIFDQEKKLGKKHIPNLHVIVSENTIMDSSIKKMGLFSDAKYLHGLTGRLEVQATDDIPKVWIPILGEGQKIQVERIADYVTPEEICPVIPSPSIILRRGDDLILEYADLLFRRLRIESTNIIYASELNPFETYRQISRTISHYQDALEPLGGCKIAISALASKLMSMGAFLVAYEGNLKNVGIAYVESKGYEMQKIATLEDTMKTSDLYSLWIFGECYESE